MTGLDFHKSSHSNPDRECVEVATNLPSTVAIRDSKTPERPGIRTTPAAWAAFLRKACST
ncbi:DUF397 domain-containing protein [Streptomyces sp. ODS28]|uniref:DUF397 domain-containing protein n=1 Tax=Streptomyces sp. ODS28 TaxID=3136688 RepID=UPI0031ECFEE5